MTATDAKVSYTRKEAAEAAGVSYDTIAAACRSGDLREVKPEIAGRRIRNGVIMRSDLLQWLEAK